MIFWPESVKGFGTLLSTLELIAMSTKETAPASAAARPGMVPGGPGALAARLVSTIDMTSASLTHPLAAPSNTRRSWLCGKQRR